MSSDPECSTSSRGTTNTDRVALAFHKAQAVMDSLPQTGLWNLSTEDQDPIVDCISDESDDDVASACPARIHCSKCGETLHPDQFSRAQLRRQDPICLRHSSSSDFNRPLRRFVGQVTKYIGHHGQGATEWGTGSSKPASMIYGVDVPDPVPMPKRMRLSPEDGKSQSTSVDDAPLEVLEIYEVDLPKEEGFYEVSHIVRHKPARNGMEFLTHWVGYDSDEDTWEPEGSFVQGEAISKAMLAYIQLHNLTSVFTRLSSMTLAVATG